MSLQGNSVIVIGGGAAGFFGAIACGEALAGRGEVQILEKGSQVLTKVKISGGGRCNVTHACFEPRPLAMHYPRGERALIGPFHQWQPEDTVAWFAERGVPLKTESDGRMFPVTNTSETIIHCLQDAAREAGVRVSTNTEVIRIDVQPDGRFKVHTKRHGELMADAILVATGGTRSAAARVPAESLGHSLEPATPSLFTFHIEDPRLKDLQGLAVTSAAVRESVSGHSASGPVLITHWGLSGPAILKLSALGAREFAERDYRFTIEVNWLPQMKEDTVREMLRTQRDRTGKRAVRKASPFDAIPRRLWARLVELAGVEEATIWSHLSRKHANSLVNDLVRSSFNVTGKSLNKDEFVTCGGVRLKDVNFKTLESRHVPGLYFAGEVLDIDGITGGFNFQSAWTTGYLAGQAIAERLGA
ncbi:MAG: putative Rossmann fold flavoprotein [Verrucomicrobiales bacterium]|jgi:predicted Rossmann fold flavoprotein